MTLVIFLHPFPRIPVANIKIVLTLLPTAYVPLQSSAYFKFHIAVNVIAITSFIHMNNIQPLITNMTVSLQSQTSATFIEYYIYCPLRKEHCTSFFLPGKPPHLSNWTLAVFNTGFRRVETLMSSVSGDHLQINSTLRYILYIYTLSILPLQLKMETIGASSPLASTSLVPLPPATPGPQRKSSCPLTCTQQAGWTLCCRELLQSLTCRMGTKCSRPWGPMSNLTRITSTTATPGWLIWAGTVRREQRSPGGGATLRRQEALPLPGCSSTIRALKRAAKHMILSSEQLKLLCNECCAFFMVLNTLSHLYVHCLVSSWVSNINVSTLLL